MSEAKGEVNPAHLQSDYDVRFDWGEHGAAVIAQPDDASVIVDVLSFSTALDVACARGALVYPYRFNDASAARFAEEQGAVLAVHRNEPGHSLSPPSLASTPAGTRLCLPSPNGSTLTLACRAARIVAGCLRNTTAVAAWAAETGRRITVVAAGERWPDGSLRPGIEDLLGAGAIINALSGTKSPEAEIAQVTWKAFRGDIPRVLREAASGRELIEQGFQDDLLFAAAVDTSDCVPEFKGGCYRRA